MRLMGRAGRPPQDPARRTERAHRILDAAAELILRWGYDKTTVDDVARQAGVAKGTIYLHWKTREALFTALLRRERVRMLAEVRRGTPATPHDLFAALALALLRRPLLKALLTGDSALLGKLVRQKWRGPGALEPSAAFDDYYTELTRLGAVRDLAGDHTLVIGSVLYGFLVAPGLLPAGPPADERIAALLADTVDRATATGQAPPAGTAHAVAQATLGYLDAVEELAQRKLDDSLNPAEERVT
ncbi:TetR/AcrR family transcriptional regulator [Planomonospora corallina]|uniref:TetR/AcrR family transcriptional regulator n=1 Tax=Planomonospora corallina TaxID=1806052 RepID=A0ABV8IFQ4_9ACTN